MKNIKISLFQDEEEEIKLEINVLKKVSRMSQFWLLGYFLIIKKQGLFSGEIVRDLPIVLPKISL